MKGGVKMIKFTNKEKQRILQLRVKATSLNKEADKVDNKICRMVRRLWAKYEAKTEDDYHNIIRTFPETFSSSKLYGEVFQKVQSGEIPKGDGSK